MFSPLTNQGAAMGSELSKRLPPSHTWRFTASSSPVAAAGASARFIANASWSAERRFSINSSRVLPWELTPGISLTHPIHHGPSPWFTAVRCARRHSIRIAIPRLTLAHELVHPSRIAQPHIDIPAGIDPAPVAWSPTVKTGQHLPGRV